MPIRTQAQIAADIASKLADNTSGDITAQDVREVFTDVNDTLATVPIWVANQGYEVSQLVRTGDGIIYI